MPRFAPGQRLFVRLRGKVAGPYSEDQLDALREQGLLLASHEVSADGDRWVTAGEMGLFPHASAPGWPREDVLPVVEEEGDFAARPRRAPARRQALPAWLMLGLAAALGLVTSLVAYFAVLRPLLRRGEPADGGPARITEQTVTGSGARRSEKKTGTGAPATVPTRLGELVLTVLPKAPRVGEEITVIVSASARGASVPYELLSLTLAGEKPDTTFDARHGAFRLKAPDRALTTCLLEVTLPADDRYEAASGSITFPIARRSRGAFDLVPDEARVSRGKPLVFSVKWAPRAVPPAASAVPTFTIDGRSVPAKMVKALGGWKYEVSVALEAGAHRALARFGRDERHEAVAARRAVMVTVVTREAAVRLALPEGGYLASAGARVGVFVTGEAGAKLTGDVELWQAGASQALALAVLKGGAAVFVLKELLPGKVDLEARYLGDGKDYDKVKAVAKSVPVVKQITYAAFTAPATGPNETRDYAFPKEARKGAEKLADHGLDAAKSYYLRLAFPAETPGTENTKHTLSGAADKGALAVSWGCSYVPYKRVEKEQVTGWLSFRLEEKDGSRVLSYEMPEKMAVQELLYEKKLYTDEPFLRRSKIAAIRRRLDALRLLRAKGALEVHEGAPEDKPGVPRLVIRLDGEGKK